MNLGEVNKPLGPPGGGGGAALAPVEAADGLRRPLGLRSGEKCVVWAPLSGHGHLVQNQRFSDQPVTAVALTLEVGPVFRHTGLKAVGDFGAHWAHHEGHVARAALTPVARSAGPRLGP